MTMNYERRNAVNRTRELLVDLLAYRYDNVSDDLWQEVRCCLKHYPGEYDMDRAADMAPEIFGDFEWYQEQERERKREREMLDALVAHDQEHGLYDL